MSKWCGDENCLQCADKEPDLYVHLPREDYQALRDERDRLARALREIAYEDIDLMQARAVAKAALTPAGGAPLDTK